MSCKFEFLFKFIDFIDRYEKLKSKDEEQAFRTIFDHCVSNKVIIQEFVNFISKQYFDIPKKDGLAFKDFMTIA